MPVWLGVGGNPNSVVRAAHLGLQLVIAIIGGVPERFAPLVDLYRQSARQAGHDPATLPVAIKQHAFIADDSDDAANTFWPPHEQVMTQIGRERGQPMTRESYDVLRSPRGALLVGDPQQVIDKMLAEHDQLKYDRFLVQFSVGTVAHDKVMRAIELLHGSRPSCAQGNGGHRRGARRLSIGPATPWLIPR